MEEHWSNCSNGLPPKAQPSRVVIYEKKQFDWLVYSEILTVHSLNHPKAQPSRVLQKNKIKALSTEIHFIPETCQHHLKTEKPRVVIYEKQTEIEDIAEVKTCVKLSSKLRLSGVSHNKIGISVRFSHDRVV